MSRTSNPAGGFSIAAVCLICAVFAPTAPADDPSTRSIMHEVYDAIAYLLPLSLRETSDRSVWDRVLIDEKLQSLNEASAALKKHTEGQEAELGAIARSFEDMTANVTKAFSNEWPEFAYFSMMDLMQHCVACHSRLEGESQVLFGQRLLARMDIRELPQSDVIRLYVATRQFDTALHALESSLMDPELHPIEADYTSDMIDYLQIAIASKHAPDEAKKFLRRYLGRSDVPFYLERRINFWISALDLYGGELTAEPSLETARAIFDAATELTTVPGDRMGAVHDIIAASIMRNYLARVRDDNAGAGEAYYMLGVIALRTMEPKSAVPEMEMLLAASITADPKGPHAVESYALIEEFGFVHEEHLANEETEQTLIDMAALRALIDAR